MKKHAAKTYFIMGALLFMLLSLSSTTSESIRMRTIAFLTPGLEALRRTKGFVDRLWMGIMTGGASLLKEEELQRLRLQNQLLASENHKLRELLQADWGGFDSQADVTAAQVIFRSPSTWNSSLWINVGREENLKLGKTIIAKNSPVLYGRSLIGVIDYAGAHQSRVRLITDSSLTPSVRAMRFKGNQAHLLAKGELHGSSKPMWRKSAQLLKGIGFNYDYADDQGPARDLRTGKSHDSTHSLPPMPIIQVNDLLVTTGLDGVFPTGLEVAIVTRVTPLNEGDYYYEIEARPTAGELDSLSYVFVIPPTGFDPTDSL